MVVPYGGEHLDAETTEHLNEKRKSKYDKDFGLLSGRYDSIVNKAELQQISRVLTPLRERRTNKKIKRKTDLRDSDNYFGDRLQSNSQSLDHRNELRFNVKNHLVPLTNN